MFILHHTHYARTFNVLGHRPRIEDTLVVRIARRVWEKNLCLLETVKYVPQWLFIRLAIVLSLQTKLVSAQQYFWHL